MNGVFGIAGGFGIAAVFAFWAAVVAIRWRDTRAFWHRRLGGLVCTFGFCVSLWIGIEYPTANFWSGQGFGADWECRNLGGKGASVCFPDKPDFGR
jgi:hypothetical protein